MCTAKECSKFSFMIWCSFILLFLTPFEVAAVNSGNVFSDVLNIPVEAHNGLVEGGLFILFLGLTVGFGAFGGYLNHLNGNLIGAKSNFRSRKLDSRLLKAHVLLGIGGAIAVLLVLVVINKFDSEITAANLLFTSCIAVVAGYGGSSFIEKVKQQLARQLEQTQKEVSNMGASISDLKGRIRHDEEAQDAINNATLVISSWSAIKGDDDPLKRESLIRDSAELMPILSKILTNQEDYSELSSRRAAIYMGRIYRAVFDDLEQAIESLTLYVDHFHGEESENLAHVLFNRACYYSLLSGKHGNKNQLLNQTHDDLTRAADICRKLGCKSVMLDVEGGNYNGKELKPDPDLENYRKWLEKRT